MYLRCSRVTISLRDLLLVMVLHEHYEHLQKYFLQHLVVHLTEQPELLRAVSDGKKVIVVPFSIWVGKRDTGLCIADFFTFKAR